jgi:hypothetical protein
MALPYLDGDSFCGFAHVPHVRAARREPPSIGIILTKVEEFPSCLKNPRQHTAVGMRACIGHGHEDRARQLAGRPRFSVSPFRLSGRGVF